MLVNDVVVDTYSFAGTGNVPAVNNGNGKADYLLSGFSSFGATDTVKFHFVFDDANDGTEQVFLVGQRHRCPCLPPPGCCSRALPDLDSWPGGEPRPEVSSNFVQGTPLRRGFFFRADRFRNRRTSVIQT